MRAAGYQRADDDGFREKSGRTGWFQSRTLQSIRPQPFSSAIFPSSRKSILPTPVPRVAGVTYRSSR